MYVTASARRFTPRLVISGCVLLALVIGAAPARAGDEVPEPLPLDEFSPGFLGMYRKVMLIEQEIRRYSDQYGLDFDLARAVCMYESGGNAGLTSIAGAQGYFQVMPATFRELRVTSNIEAGIKYLSQLVTRFEREDRAVAAYNGGPGRVGRAGGLPLETLQYVLGVNNYRKVLKAHDASLRRHAARLNLASVLPGDDWNTLAKRFDIPAWELRIYNPFLAAGRLRAGQIVAYPSDSGDNPFRVNGDHIEYRMRHGDNYIKLAFTLGLDLEALRRANALWQLDPAPAGVTLRIPLSADRANVLRAAVELVPDTAVDDTLLVEAAGNDRESLQTALAIDRDPVLEPASVQPVPPVGTASSAPQRASMTHRVARGDTLGGIAAQYGTSIGAIQQANGLGRRTTVRLGETLRIPGTSTAAAPRAASVPARATTHRVVAGDTLAGLAQRYGVSTSAIQSVNRMGNRTTIRVGETLQIPGPGATTSSATARASRPTTHRVSSGDTLAGVAQRYGTSIRALQDANDMGRRTVIRLGELLRIP